ncbi:MAG: phage portal protein, partial [Patescibacteria group bacterium]|nr:phage portal protein [Patescibacteria group bacterium]
MAKKGKRRHTVAPADTQGALREKLAKDAPVLVQARDALDGATRKLATSLQDVAAYMHSRPALAKEIMALLREQDALVTPAQAVSEGQARRREEALATSLKESVAILEERAGDKGRPMDVGQDYSKIDLKPPKGKGRQTLPEAERTFQGDIKTSFFSSDVHNKVRKIALYQAWLGESWASSSIDAIASRICSGGWMLEPVNKKKPNTRTKWWVDDYFGWCNADENFIEMAHDGLVDLGWAGECFLEVTWRYSQTLHREIPYELYTVDPISMEYVLSPDRRRIVGYKQVNDAGMPIKLEPRQIVRVWFPDPRNRLKALSHLEKLLNPLVLDMYLQASEQRYFQHGNRGDVAIIAKRADRVAAIRLMEFLEEHALGIKNSHRPLVIYGDNEDIEVQNLANRDTMDVPGRRAGVRQEIQGSLHVPPHQLGIIEGGSLGGQGATYVMEKQFVHTGCDPFKEKYFAPLNFDLIGVGFGVIDWKVTTQYADLRDDKDVTDIEKEQVQSGFMTINMVLAKHKMDPVEGGDVPFIVVGSQLVPVAHLPQLAAGPAVLPGAPAPGMGAPGAPGTPGTSQAGGQQSSFGTSGRSGTPAGDNK